MQPNRQFRTIPFSTAVCQASPAPHKPQVCVMTQIPYALLAGGVSLLAYLAAGAVFL